MNGSKLALCRSSLRPPSLSFAELPAIELRERQLSYRDLNARATKTAAAFSRDGLGRGMTIGSFFGNTPDYPINVFGALKAGARVVHLGPLDGEIALVRI
jgi:long-chain acyl-CoA synthetase